jgi:outer membrane protein TolC
LPLARAKLLPQLSASLTGSRQNTNFGGGFPASSGNSNGYVISLTQPLIHVDSWDGYAQGQLAVDSAQASFAQARQDLIVRLGQAYFDALAESVDRAAARIGAALVRGRQYDDYGHQRSAGQIRPGRVAGNWRAERSRGEAGGGEAGGVAADRRLTIPLFAGGATQSRVRQTLALEDQAAAISTRPGATRRCRRDRRFSAW